MLELPGGYTYADAEKLLNAVINVHPAPWRRTADGKVLDASGKPVLRTLVAGEGREHAINLMTLVSFIPDVFDSAFETAPSRVVAEVAAEVADLQEKLQETEEELSCEQSRATDLEADVSDRDEDLDEAKQDLSDFRAGVRKIIEFGEDRLAEGKEANWPLQDLVVKLKGLHREYK
jgi:hypothetical protein